MKRPMYKTPNMASMILTIRKIDETETEMYNDIDAFGASSECASFIPSTMYKKRVEVIRCFEKQNGISFRRFLDDLKKWIKVAVQIKCIDAQIWYYSLHEWEEAFNEMCLNREKMLDKIYHDRFLAMRLPSRYYRSWCAYRHQEAHHAEMAARHACYVATIACCPIHRDS